MEDGVRGKDRSAPMRKEVPIPPKSGDDQEGLSQEQRAVCREAAVGIVFPSHSLFGSFNEAVACGLLHANPMERVDLEAALVPRSRLDWVDWWRWRRTGAGFAARGCA